MSTPEQHVQTMEMVFSICRMTLAVDPEELAALIDQFSFEEAAGPIFDPSGFMKAGQKLWNAGETVRAFAKFNREITRMYDKEMKRVEKITGINHRAAEDAEEAEGKT